MSQSQIQVRNGLGLNTLRSIHHQQRPLARSYGTRYFIRKIHVSGSVYEIQRILLPVVHVVHLNGVALYRDAFFAFEVHVVKHLRLQFALGKRTGLLQKAVGERALAVVDMGYYAEVAYVFHKNVFRNTKVRKIFGITDNRGRNVNETSNCKAFIAANEIPQKTRAQRHVLHLKLFRASVIAFSRYRFHRI